MVTLTATETSSRTMLIYEGKNSLPSQQTILGVDFGDSLYLRSDGSQICSSFGWNGSFDYPNAQSKVYIISKDGYLAYTGNATISDVDITATGKQVFFNNHIYMSVTDNINTFYILESVIPLSLVDGFAVSGMSVSSGGFISPYTNYDLSSTLDGNIYANDGFGYEIIIDDLDSDLSSYYVLLPDGLGNLVQKGVAEFNRVTNPFISYVQCYKGIYRSINSANESSNGWNMSEFNLVNFGDPFDCVFYDLAFDIEDYFARAYDIFTDGENFYLTIPVDSDGNPINPILIKVNFEWTEYEKIFIQAGDSGTQARISNYLAGNGSISFAYDYTSGHILMTAGNEPMFYGIDAPPDVGNRSTTRPTPYKLPCIVNCIPMIKGK